MPKFDLTEIQGKKTLHLELNEAMDQVTEARTERIANAVHATYARTMKASAKARGLTIKQFVMQAVDAHYSNL